MRRATGADRLDHYWRTMYGALPRIDDLDRLGRYEVGFTLQGPLAVYGPVRTHATGPDGCAARLTWAYLTADSKLIHEAWEALTKDEQSLVRRQIIQAAVGKARQIPDLNES